MAGERSRTVEKERNEVFEAWGVTPVPENLRYGNPGSQFRMWFGANAVVSSLFVGMLGPVVFGLSFWATLTAIMVGTLLSALAVGTGSTFGPRTGMVMILFSRFTFGYWVGRILGFLNALYCYSWSAVNLVTGTAAVQLGFVLMGLTALGTGKGSYTMWVIVIAAITTVISVFGYNLVHRWENASTIASLVVFAILTVAVLANHPHAGASTSSGIDFWKSWFGMALAAFGFGIGWVPYVSDYSRKLPVSTSRRSVFLAAFGGLALSTIWVEGLGALISTTVPKVVGSSDVVHGIPAIFGNTGYVIVGLLIIGLSTISNNIPNDYTGGLSALAAGIPVPRWTVTLVGGVLSAFTAVLLSQDFANRFNEFLLMVSYWVGAWFVLVAYNYWKRGGRYNAADWDSPRNLPTGVGPTIAFAAALIAAWIGMYPGSSVSWNILGQGLIGTHVGVDLGFVLAIAVALIIRIALDLVLPQRTQRSVAGS